MEEYKELGESVDTRQTAAVVINSGKSSDDRGEDIQGPAKQPTDTSPEITDALNDASNSPLDVNKVSDWKNTLSGALDDQQLFCALFVLGLFSIFYTLVNTTHIENRDEDRITELCRCNPRHRSFYIIWFSVCSFLWTVCHFSITIADSNFNFHECISIKLKQLFGCLKNCCFSFTCCCYHRCCWCCWCWLKPLYDKFLHYLLDKEKLSRYEFHLWTQYCELYVVGITKHNENFNFDRVEEIIKETLQNSSEPSEQGNYNAVPDNTVMLPKYHKQRNLRYALQVIYFISLKLIQFIAQLFIVPLLLILMFDTYAFLCFADDSYCTISAEYKLHLDQTAFTFGFYAALVTSLLSTLMLRRNPWPELLKEDRNSII